MIRSNLSQLIAPGKIALAMLLASGAALPALAQNGSTGGAVDPGPRSGTTSAGGALPGLGTKEKKLFNAALARFGEVDSVSGTIDDAPSGRLTGGGLGPVFNGNSCQLCHAFPDVGGSSPPMNPQISLATLDGAKNSIPSFITANGPTREARFIHTANGAPDGGVHDLFVITGRSDASGCTITQPNFPQAIAGNNIIFRIPTPLFGGGQIENVPDINLMEDSSQIASQQAAMGITSGDFNLSGNDGTITRFGWKAQNKSLLIFAGEAYNVEQGVTNELFPNERVDVPNCLINPLPEDALNLTNPGTEGFDPSDFSSDVENFAAFMRLLAGPTPAASTTAIAAGEESFESVGCSLCHVPTHVTGPSIFTNQSFVTFQPFTDLALHDMGTGLADQISQGGANGSQFRTAPLWGVGQRIFFLHDGRTNNLLTAIEDHMSSGSEANMVIQSFNALSVTSQQDILDFLRSL
jgi:CxxC motif-containing protein (DUF1111 family)